MKSIFKSVARVLFPVFLSVVFLASCAEQGDEGVREEAVPEYAGYLPFFYADEREAVASFGSAFRPLFPDASTLRNEKWFVGFSCEYCRSDGNACENDWEQLLSYRPKQADCYYYMSRFERTDMFAEMDVSEKDFADVKTYGGKLDDYRAFYKETVAVKAAEVCRKTDYFPMRDGSGCVFLFAAPKRISRDSAEYRANARYRIAYEGENLALSPYATEEEARAGYPQYWRSDQTFRSFLPLQQHPDTGRVSGAFCETNTFDCGGLRIRGGIMQFSVDYDVYTQTYDRLYAAYIQFETEDDEYWTMLPIYAVRNAPRIEKISDPAYDDENFTLLEPVAAKVQTYLFETYWKSKLPGENG